MRWNWPRREVVPATGEPRSPEAATVVAEVAPPVHLPLVSRNPVEMWPVLAGAHARVTVDIDHGWELPHAERVVLDVVTRMVAPSVVVEFGTFTGATTLLLAEAAPAGAVIHTVDVPDAMIGAEWQRFGVSAATIGSRLRGRGVAGREIVQHRMLTSEFDAVELERGADLIFIDASHEYEDVVADTELALTILREDGVIIWDDYGGPHTGVTAALAEFADRCELAHIGYTRLAAFGRGTFAFAPR